MKRVPAVAVVLVLLTASVAAVVGASVGASPRLAAANESAPLPGSQYTGVVGAQGAEVEAAYDEQAFGARFADAVTNESKAAVIASEVEAIRDRLAELELRRDALANASGDEFEEDGESARTTTFVAKSVALGNRLDRVENAAATLPAEIRESHDITASVFGTLADRVDALTTTEMVDVAHDVAGEDVGEDFDEEGEEDGDEEDAGDGEDGDGSEGEGGDRENDGDDSEDESDGGDGTEADGDDGDSETNDGSGSSDETDGSDTSEGGDGDSETTSSDGGSDGNDGTDSGDGSDGSDGSDTDDSDES